MFTKLRDDAVMPARATLGSAGYDLSITDGATIEPGETVMFGTGIAFSEPVTGLFGLVAPRSSMCTKYKVMVPNSIGVIDSDYVGHEIKFPLTNIGTEAVYIPNGERIGQLIFVQWFAFEGEEPVTAERVGGFGSTDE